MNDQDMRVRALTGDCCTVSITAVIIFTDSVKILLILFNVAYSLELEVRKIVKLRLSGI
jgi:hypothetical protein